MARREIPLCRRGQVQRLVRVNYLRAVLSLLWGV